MVEIAQRFHGTVDLEGQQKVSHTEQAVDAAALLQECDDRSGGRAGDPKSQARGWK